MGHKKIKYLWPPDAYHRLGLYIQRGGRVSLPHVQLSPGPVSGWCCEWGDMERGEKKDKVLICGIAWISLENIMVKQRRWTQNATFIKCPE